MRHLTFERLDADQLRKGERVGRCFIADRARVDTIGADELEIELTAEELEVRREHIEALGYVN